MRRLALTAILLRLLLIITQASAQTPAPLPQRFLGDLSRRPSHFDFPPIRVEEATINFDGQENVLEVSGVDRESKPWKVYFAPPGGISVGTAWLGSQLNSRNSFGLIFVLNKGAQGRCVFSSRVIILSFGADRRPIPWIAETNPNLDYDWQSESNKGLLDIGDWNRNGKPEVVQFECLAYEYQEAEHTAYGMGDVYETTDTGYWRRLSVAERVGHEPAYRKIARDGERELYPRPKDLGSFLPDYSNDPVRGIKTRIVAESPVSSSTEGCGVLWDSEVIDGQIVPRPAKERELIRARCNSHLVIEDGVRCFGHPAVVIYTPTGTVADLSGDYSRTSKLIEQIIAAKVPVTLTGQTDEGLCSPAMIWATLP